MIHGKNFLLRCSGLLVDKSDYNPNQYFLHCFVDNSRGCLLCTDVDSTQNYFVRNLNIYFSVYYNESMIKSGLVAVHMKKWMLCPIFGDLPKKATPIDFFLDVRGKEGYDNWGEDEMRLQISSRNILLYNGSTGRVLEKVLLNPGLAAISKRLLSVENKIILTNSGVKYGYVLVEINQRNIVETFLEDIPRIVFIIKSFEEEGEFSSKVFIRDSNIMLEIMNDKFIDVVPFYDDKKFFVLIRDFLPQSYLIENIIDAIRLHQISISTSFN